MEFEGKSVIYKQQFQSADPVDMNRVVGTCDILFLCMDALRFDVARGEQESGGTPVLNRYGIWRRCKAPGNFTYPSHQAMFAGFFPVDDEIKYMPCRERLFFSKDIGMGRKAPEGAFDFQEATWVQSLEKLGYETICIGGVSFFDKRTELGRVLPGIFKNSYWQPAFGPRVPESAQAQVDFARKKLNKISRSTRVMMYINISALHYPTYFYMEKEFGSAASGGNNGYGELNQADSVESQAAALRYVDSQLEGLFFDFAGRGKTFVICCADHGTCFGEDGCWYHGIDHPLVNAVPYKHFFL